VTSQGTKGRILVVDDEPDITLTLEAGLEIVGLFNVETFNDPESALKSFKPNYYALCFDRHYDAKDGWLSAI
jgi:DNA-binding NtrC family response regulator